MFLYVAYLDHSKDAIFKYKYPRFSNLCFFLCVTLILLYNPAQILGTLAGIILLLFAINNPLIKRTLDPIMNNYFFKEELMNPYARENVKSLKEFEQENVMKNVYAKSEKEEHENVKKAKKLEKKEGFYRSFKRIYLSVLHTFGKACDFLEKFKKYLGFHTYQ